MACRIHHHVTRGEVDCRKKGTVSGELWLHGAQAPVMLKLTGCAWEDMAGCMLTFQNKAETCAVPRDWHFASVQEGSAGDMTASRKVRVPDVPVTEFHMRRKRGGNPPEHLANCLYLEWFSESNGRVVFESTDCEITLSAPEWRLTPEEEEQRARDAAAGMAGFMEKLTQAVEQADAKVPWDKEEWDEFDHEKMLRESDARTEKYGELLEKYMDHPDRERIIAREMGWDHILEMLDAEEERAKRGGDGGTPQDASHGAGDGIVDWDDYEEPEPDPATEGKDWIRTGNGGIKHPLSHRAFESAIALWHRVDELGLKESADEDLGALLQEFSILGAKLAGALDGMARHPDIGELAHNVARMKRGLTHLHAAQAALVRVEEKRLLPAEDLDGTREELFTIREEMLRLMQEYRGR